MDYEVELKFPLPDPARLDTLVERLSLEFTSSVVQVDRYFGHPSRDFSQTDEAFRLRQIGERNFVTYKGPRIDKQTKTRRELELTLPDGTQAIGQFTELWLALGFREVGTVTKTRRETAFHWKGRSGHVAHDTIEELGQFVELEFIADTNSLDRARAELLELAGHLELPTPEPRSYLELVLEADSERADT